MKKVFIDGSAGTTGLRIADRLSERKDITLITLPEEKRKDVFARKDALNRADIVFLCLPDDAAREAVGMIENPNVAVIDTSTAHRTEDGWVYGFPELGALRETITGSKRIANPGCHASGFTALVRPLTQTGILKKSARLSCFSLTGYSGGGKKMIADYETNEFSAPRQYGLSQNHKHLREMKAVGLLEKEPLFMPVVGNFYSGMEVTVPVAKEDLCGGINDIKKIYAEYYGGKIVRFEENVDENGFLSAAAFSGRDDMQISVFGNDERIILVSRFDNLGKGASGAAVQNMNILLGVEETTGLNIGG